jgi:hypothetical protein
VFLRLPKVYNCFKIMLGIGKAIVGSSVNWRVRVSW